jgi:hypothetical protein
MIVGALVLPEVISGMTEASTTHSPRTPSSSKTRLSRDSDRRLATTQPAEPPPMMT